MLAALLPLLGGIIKSVLGAVLPNPEDELKRQQIQTGIVEAVLAQQGAIEKAAADNVQAEIKGESWLQRNWRPVTMLVFVGLIVARFLGYSAPGLSPNEALELWAIVKIGLGGYTIGRSAEKIAPQVASIFKGVSKH